MFPRRRTSHCGLAIDGWLHRQTVLWRGWGRYVRGGQGEERRCFLWTGEWGGYCVCVVRGEGRVLYVCVVKQVNSMAFLCPYLHA